MLASYLAFLELTPTIAQSNGLRGDALHGVCDLWNALDPSSQSVFLTITHRLYGTVLDVDASPALSHVVTIYRIAGGQDADADQPGTCGGGEYNRMIMHMDAVLHDAQIAAAMHQGALQSDGKYDMADIGTDFWRDSHDLGGPHVPFDDSDETNTGAPRGQTQYFADPTSTLANTALGRLDVTTLVDPYALEMDEDYDCVHNSNPACSYTTYGPACLPEASELGTAIYAQDYGDFDPAYKPSGC